MVNCWIELLTAAEARIELWLAVSLTTDKVKRRLRSRGVNKLEVYWIGAIDRFRFPRLVVAESRIQ